MNHANTISRALLFGAAIMTGCATFEAGAPDGMIDVIAHRGASAYAPENTLAAFRVAADMGADWFELDCTLTKDGAVLVIHDDDLERTTTAAGYVRDWMLEDLRKVEAGAWFDAHFAGEPLPTLDQALDFAKGRIGVYIEIKDSDDDSLLERALLALAAENDRLLPHHRSDAMALIAESGTRNLELTRKVIQMVDQRSMDRQIVIQSFSPVVCAAALIEAPHLRTELLASSDPDRPEQWSTFLRWAELLGAPGFNVNKRDVTPELVADLHRQGKTVAVWTVNTEEDIRTMAEAGVDAIISDKPDLVLSVLGR